MKTPKTASSKKQNNNTPKTTQPKPLKIVHPSPQITVAPSSSKEYSGTPSASTMHVGNKRPLDTPTHKSLSKSANRAKKSDPNSAEEISKEITAGFGLDKYWYESNPFPQLHAILQNQHWETLMTDYCCNPIKPDARIYFEFFY